MDISRKAALAFRMNNFQLIKLMGDIWVGDKLGDVFIRPVTETYVTTDAIVTEDLGWGIFQKGEPDYIGLIKIKSYDIGQLMIYWPIQDADWPPIDYVATELFQIIERLGFEIVSPTEPPQIDIQGWVENFIVEDESKLFSSGSKSTSKQGPTLNTRMRFDTFHKIKEKHPTWNQEKVALEANDQLGEHFTAESVRNAYRSMGVKWERGDRVR